MDTQPDQYASKQSTNGGAKGCLQLACWTHQVEGLAGGGYANVGDSKGLFDDLRDVLVGDGDVVRGERRAGGGAVPGAASEGGGARQGGDGEA